MRKIIVGAFMSLDGIMQAPGGPDEDPVGEFKYGGWAVSYFDKTMGKAVGEMFAKPFDLLLGFLQTSRTPIRTCAASRVWSPQRESMASRRDPLGGTEAGDWYSYSGEMIVASRAATGRRCRGGYGT
jgi:hypothetical protein